MLLLEDTAVKMKFQGVHTLRMAVGQRTTAEKHVRQARDLISKHAE